MKTIIFFWWMMLGFITNTFAQIQGDVVDPKDKGIPNAIIIAIDTDRKFADTVKSDNRGFYEFKSLKPGKYKIEAKAGGFQSAILENVVVKEGDIGTVKGQEDLYRGQRLDITLNPAKVPKQ